MKILAQLVSLIALAGLVVPAVLFLSGSLDQETVKELLLYATMVWFVSAPYWMLTPNGDETEQVTSD